MELKKLSSHLKQLELNELDFKKALNKKAQEAPSAAQTSTSAQKKEHVYMLFMQSIAIEKLIQNS